MELFSFPWISSTFRHYFIFCPSHCPVLNQMTEQSHTSSCSTATRCRCSFNPGVWPPKGILRCLQGSGSSWAELHMDIPGSGQRGHMQRTRGCSHAFSQQIAGRITKGEEAQPSQTIKSLSQDSSCLHINDWNISAYHLTGLGQASGGSFSCRENLITEPIKNQNAFGEQ